MARLVLAVVSVIIASVVGNDVSFQEDSMPTDDACLTDPNHEDCGLSLRQLRGTKLQADEEDEEAADNEEVQVDTKGALGKATDMDGDAILAQVNTVRSKQVNGIMAAPVVVAVPAVVAAPVVVAAPDVVAAPVVVAGGELKNAHGVPMSDADKASQPIYHCPPHVACLGSCRDEPFGGRTRETECNPAKEACGPVYCASGWCLGTC
ncbi:unnamed protein product [Polarella glacialis]|uniref:Uncharacterized protein n=1 Tax=Polarella glacialis TaxID=89957 RepID=A0A813GSB5_POLGL|nr:unnamed protein product [Polarella glacialis]CAE8710556.1 unnamed protein product [Polarella glacialis]